MRLPRSDSVKFGAEDDCLQREQLAAWFKHVQAIGNGPLRPLHAMQLQGPHADVEVSLPEFWVWAEGQDWHIPKRIPHVKARAPATETAPAARDAGLEYAVIAGQSENASDEAQFDRRFDIAAQRLKRQADRAALLGQTPQTIIEHKTKREELAYIDGELRTLDDKEAAANAEAPAAVVNTTTDKRTRAVADHEWKEQAREAARAIVKREAAHDRYPPQVAIADEIAADFRKRRIFGTDGKPLSGGNIKRNALKGISSAVKKAQSTTLKRGK